MRFVKGHGTENDFVLVPDPDGELELTSRLVRALCDRRAGVGGDGVLRVVRSAKHPDGVGMAADAEWFMDYRNADGSAAQMCGNGARVFLRYLLESGLAALAAGESMALATRGGVRRCWLEPDGQVTVALGPAVPGAPGPAAVSVGDRTWPALTLGMPNPHAVAFVDDLAEAGDLASEPVLSPATAFPEGANVEFVTRVGPGHVAMRVHERGVGETRSCGTGAGAAVVAAMEADGAPDEASYRLDVPGGALRVRRRAGGEVELTGPAVLVASGDVDDAWVLAHR